MWTIMKLVIYDIHMVLYVVLYIWDFWMVDSTNPTGVIISVASVAGSSPVSEILGNWLSEGVLVEITLARFWDFVGFPPQKCPKTPPRVNWGNEFL